MTSNRKILITNDFKTLKFADFGYGKKFEKTEDNLHTNCGTVRYKVRGILELIKKVIEFEY